MRVTLSDLYPNAGALSDARLRSDGRLNVRTTPVDATDVPADLTPELGRWVFRRGLSARRDPIPGQMSLF